MTWDLSADLLVVDEQMSSGEILTRVTIWITLVGYVAGTSAFALSISETMLPRMEFKL